MRSKTLARDRAILVREQVSVGLGLVSDEGLAREVQRVGCLELDEPIAWRPVEEPADVLDNSEPALLDRGLETPGVVAGVVLLASGILDPTRAHLVDLPAEVAHKAFDGCAIPILHGKRSYRRGMAETAKAHRAA